VTNTNVLCVDPDAEIRAEVGEALRSDLLGMDPTVESCGTIDAATAVIGEQSIDCLVTEYDLPDGTGLDLARRFRRAEPEASIVLFTDRAHDEMETDGDTIVTEYVGKSGDDALTRLATLVEMTVRLRSQVSYPLPDDEDGRLSALERYDFDSPELGRALDRLTDLAVEHFGVDIASVNVIEEREQRLFACKGLEGVDTVSREDSICTFTIVNDDPVMTVEDVREDPRFEGRGEQFDALDIRSYMGAQLVTPAGFPVGTLCIYGSEPRQFTAADREYLQTLAELGVDLLTAHARLNHGETEADDVPPGTEPDGGGEDSDENGSQPTTIGEAFE